MFLLAMVYKTGVNPLFVFKKIKGCPVDYILLEYTAKTFILWIIFAELTYTAYDQITRPESASIESLQ